MLIYRFERLSKRQRSEGYSFVELMLTVALTSVLSASVVPQLLFAWDRARQRSSMADMRSMALANDMYRLDNEEYAPALGDLSPYLSDPVKGADFWSTPWAYSSDGVTYTLSSLGSDGATGPAAPIPWYDEPFEVDIIVQNGSFTQAPENR